MVMLQNIKVLDRCYYRLKSSADSVVTDWNSGYRNSYIANNGTSVSSVNSTTNNFVKNLEKNIRSGKLEFLQDLVA
jgi:hypothetical protein